MHEQKVFIRELNKRIGDFEEGYGYDELDLEAFS